MVAGTLRSTPPLRRGPAVTNFAQDMAVKQAWGLTLHQWNQARETDRRYWREHLTTAPNFKDN